MNFIVYGYRHSIDSVLIALLEFLPEADTLRPSERVQFHYV